LKLVNDHTILKTKTQIVKTHKKEHCWYVTPTQRMGNRKRKLAYLSSLSLLHITYCIEGW
jgi:hypothetical protein